MISVSEEELLRIWEIGQVRHHIDRTLLLCTLARPDLEGEQLARLPLGEVNSNVLRTRAELFGHRLELQTPCDHCDEMMEIPLDINELLAQVNGREVPEEIEVCGFRFRLPTSLDLVGIAYETDIESASLRLLGGCCQNRDSGGVFAPEVVDKADSALEEADPMADLRFDAVCPVCGHQTEAVFEPGIFLWGEVQAYARSVFIQIHTLAAAYGWTEQDVLALSPRRRKVYLDIVERGETIIGRGIS